MRHLAIHFVGVYLLAGFIPFTAYTNDDPFQRTFKLAVFDHPSAQWEKSYLTPRYQKIVNQEVENLCSSTLGSSVTYSLQEVPRSRQTLDFFAIETLLSEPESWDVWERGLLETNWLIPIILSHEYDFLYPTSEYSLTIKLSSLQQEFKLLDHCLHELNSKPYKDQRKNPEAQLLDLWIRHALKDEKISPEDWIKAHINKEFQNRYLYEFILKKVNQDPEWFNAYLSICEKVGFENPLVDIRYILPPFLDQYLEALETQIHSQGPSRESIIEAIIRVKGQATFYLLTKRDHPTLEDTDGIEILLKLLYLVNLDTFSKSSESLELKYALAGVLSVYGTRYHGTPQISLRSTQEICNQILKWMYSTKKGSTVSSIKIRKID